GVIRKATPGEVLLLQGFEPEWFEGVAAKDVYRMAGNAVAAPVGRRVFDSLSNAECPRVTIGGFYFTGEHGLFENGTKRAVEHSRSRLAVNLWQFVDSQDRETLSAR